jgi:hypothetical protein
LAISFRKKCAKGQKYGPNGEISPKSDHTVVHLFVCLDSAASGGHIIESNLISSKSFRKPEEETRDNKSEEVSRNLCFKGGGQSLQINPGFSFFLCFDSIFLVLVTFNDQSPRRGAVVIASA